MNVRTVTARVLSGCAAASLCFSVTIAVQLSREEGDRLQRKIDEIAKNASAVPVRPKKTRVTENELNSYLAINARDKIHPGLTQPEITMIGEGWLAGRGLVDLDEFKRHRSSQGFLDPLNYLSGKVPVTARGHLRANGAKGQFTLESAHIHGISLPKPILQELVTYFTRSPGLPGGLDMDKPFDLPAKIREIMVGKGEATIVQ